MKVMNITNVTQVDNVKIFKPVSKIFIKTIYHKVESPKPGASPFMGYYSDPLIRVRLVDGRSGRSDEIVPEMRLSVLSEIASKYEGFQRRALQKSSTDVPHGFDLSSVILGAIVGTGLGEDCAAIDLSNDKYLDIDMREMSPFCEYEIWGFEHYVISSYARYYRKFYLSAGELEKTIHVEGNEVLVYPMDSVKEIQFYAKNGASPVYRKEELVLDEDTRNDLVTVGLNGDNYCELINVLSSPEALPIRFGYSNWGVVDIRPYNRFDFRRDEGEKALSLIMIDTMPSLPTVVANVVIPDPSPALDIASDVVVSGGNDIAL